MQDYLNPFNLGMLWFVIEKTVFESQTFKPWITPAIMSKQNLKNKLNKDLSIQNKKTQSQFAQIKSKVTVIENVLVNT